MNDFFKIADEILNAIKNSNRILLHLHPSPDPDSAGSVLALAEACRSLGKEVVAIGGDSDLSPSLAALPGFETIIPTAYSDIEVGQFDLFLILDSASVNMISKKGAVVFPSHLKTVVIDHHISNPGFGQINLIDSSRPATAEIIFELLTAWHVALTATMAANLYAGLYSDTGGFKYPEVTPRTLEVGAELLKVNPQATRVVLDLERSMTKGALRYWGLALNSAEEVAGGRAGMVALSFSDLESAGINYADTEGLSISGDLLLVRDYVVVATLVEKELGRVRLSLRSKNPDLVDVSKIAATFGGGGHRAAAGALLLMPLAEAKAKVATSLGRTLGI
ncbi:MAG: hypothetical protein A2589_00085 [Candidatus Vogelbacteria bacterium RIFOXYD1_FULL_46_19]|uniref:DDH domain-containing protein n=1 Tax=Candidatus Vogelbacteria bacterium RIFOXYD1_FULL_46_19 TaxID=1802439 RepID=A0A1G2QHG9_9BACT|nr:MAG: hypothetical protein A2589_00085 [Candidatus Vogelbacteria bacterium RIFOXYD1_FULL_46_19]